MIDTGVQLPVHGRLYICAANDRRPGCLAQMARLDGMLESQTANIIKTQEEEIVLLLAKIEELQKGKFVQVGDVAELLGNVKASEPVGMGRTHDPLWE